MRSAYIALVTSYGLETLLPENEETRRWSLSTATRHRLRCLWAHVDSQDAAELHELLSAGEGERALKLLNAAADAVGPLH